MSHSVFRDFDDEKLTDTNGKNEIADQNLVVFINKDGGVTVDQSALEDLIGECAKNLNKSKHRNICPIAVLFIYLYGFVCLSFHVQ